MEGRMFLLSSGHVYIRGNSGQEVSFNNLDEFSKYYSGTIDLSNEYYIDYEPEKRVFYYKNNSKDYSPLENRYNDAIREYEEVIADVRNMLEKMKDPYFKMNIEEARTFRKNEIKAITFRTITHYMPEWKQIRWNQFMRLHERLKNDDKLTLLEQAIYNAFPDGNRCHDDCYEDCIKAARWILECIVQNDFREREVSRAASIAVIKSVPDPDYPGWVLEIPSPIKN